MAARTTRSSVNEPSETISEWFLLHGKSLAIGAIVLAVAAGGFYAYRQSTHATNRSAEAALYSAQTSFASGNVQLAQTDLGQVIDRYQGTDAATQAAMLLAQTYYDNSQWDEGISALRRVEGSAGSDFAAAVHGLLGTGLEGKGDFAAAAQAYLEAASEARFDLTADSHRADAARAYTSAGSNAEAVAIWEELAASPESPHAAEARVRLGELTATAAGS